MSDRKLSWFKHGVQYDAKFSGCHEDGRTKGKITIFCYGDLRDAINEVIKQANFLGFENVTIDHIRRVR